MEKKRVLMFLSAVVVALVMAACSDNGSAENPNDRLEAETASIDSYLTGKGVTAIKDVTGVRVVIYKMGEGFPAKKTSTVEVDYTGRLFPDGVSFDEGTAKDQALSKYIPGWQIALGLLPEGSRARIYIPSYWAYGTAGYNSIPGNATLEFDISFKKLVRTSAELQRLGTDSVAIDKYLTDKGIEAVKDTLGLRYVINEQGGGAKPTLYSKIKVKLAYKLLTDDTKVVGEVTFEPDDNYDSRPANQISDGIKRMLTKMPVGSKVTLYMPSLMAFGPYGATSGDNNQVIPANANVIVDLNLIEIVE
jgi:FKBP-type peptidyl-prolyl cis-trans isomerase FkpA